MAVTAGWPLPKLLAALARSGWADLDGGAQQGVRSTLRALCDLLPHGSGVGKITTAQVADAAGLSVKWTGRCLRVLEECGMISWTRGQVIAGRPRPGIIKVSKRVLADLVNKARKLLPERTAARATETAERIRTTLRTGRALNRGAGAEPPPTGRRGRAPLKDLSTRHGAQNPLSVHTELSDPLPPNGEGLTSPSTEKNHSETLPGSRWSRFVARRAELNEQAQQHEQATTTKDRISA